MTGTAPSTRFPLIPQLDEPDVHSLSPESLRAPVENDTASPGATFLTVEELAELLRLNRKTVYDALARGDIPGARWIGGTYRILRDAVLTWFSSGQGCVSRSRRKRR